MSGVPVYGSCNAGAFRGGEERGGGCLETTLTRLGNGILRVESVSLCMMIDEEGGRSARPVLRPERGPPDDLGEWQWPSKYDKVVNIWNNTERVIASA